MPLAGAGGGGGCGLEEAGASLSPRFSGLVISDGTLSRAQPVHNEKIKGQHS